MPERFKKILKFLRIPMKTSDKSTKTDSLRPPKGTLDLSPQDSIIKNTVVEICRGVFEAHNGLPIETPTFELRSNLQDKYGEDTKLVFNLEDQGGDICSLRYDLTVPFARYLSKNKIQKMRKYQIGNVYRRDNPSKGRLREFSQADFDIGGDNLQMVDDSEIVRMISDILDKIKRKFSLPDFTIRINDRRILIGLLENCGITRDLQVSICSTIDKVDKLTTMEMVNELRAKGLDYRQIEYLVDFMSQTGTNEEILRYLEGKVGDSPRQSEGRDAHMASQEGDPSSGAMGDKLSVLQIDGTAHSKHALETEAAGSEKIQEEFRMAILEMRLLLKYTRIYDITQMKIDLSLARGLSYYTGIILEGKYSNSGFGSICGGGRYDNLCRSISNHSVRCVGFSIGISRLCAFIQATSMPMANNFEVFVGSGFGLMQEHRMHLLGKLWTRYRAETFTGKRINFKDQISYSIKNNFKVAVFTGENEEKEGKLNLINLKTMEKLIIREEDMVDEINRMISDINKL